MNSNHHIPTPPTEKLTLSQRFADAVTAGMGSWTFIIGQAVAIAGWIALNKTNVAPMVPQWDPQLILLNLALSCEAAFAGAFILMSQNRSAQKDRQMAENDYLIDCESERAIRELDRKVNILLTRTEDKAAAPLNPSVNDNAEAMKPAADKMAPK